MSRAGGSTSASGWYTKVINLRPGDYMRCASWSGSHWFGGEVLVVDEVKRTGLRDGHMNVDVHYLRAPEHTRQLCMRADDEVTLEARDATPVECTYVPPAKKRVVKGPQLELKF